MRILFIIPSLSNGGQERAGMILCNYLMQYHTVLAVCYQPASLNEYNYLCEIERIILPVKNGLLARIYGLIKKIRLTKKVKKKFQPTISIAFGDNAIVINYLTATKEIKIASLRHSFKNSLLIKTAAEKIYDKLYRFCLKKADKIVPVSNEINKELQQIFDIENTLFVTNGYDLEDINLNAVKPIANNLAIFFNDKVIAHTGRYDATKCHLQLVKFFVLVKQKEPSAKLILLGGIDPSQAENGRIYEFCISYLSRWGCNIIYADQQYTVEEISAADVLITGHQTNPFNYLSKATLFVFPSVLEGFPNALIEAMACGLPVISSDCPTGPKEILKDDNTNESFGILLPVFSHKVDFKNEAFTENHTLWADTIIKLLRDKTMLIELRNKSLYRSNQYAVEKVCKKWLDILGT